MSDDAGAANPDGQAPVDSGLKGRLEDYLAARTPSPFLHPAAEPTDASLLMNMMPLPGPGLGCGYDNIGGNAPIAFGDLPPDFELTGFDGGDAQPNFGGGMPYDPSSGMYLGGYDWSMQYGHECYPMMGGMPLEGGVDEFGNCLPVLPNGGVGHTEQLLAALSEKLAAGRDNGICQSGLSADCPEAAGPLAEGFGEAAPAENGCLDGGALGGDGANVEVYGGAEMLGGPSSRAEGGGSGGGRKGRNRDRGERGGRGGGVGQELSAAQNTAAAAPTESEGPVTFTTVMFRNIPNKYTREMLVKQLEQELKGHFDFVYLPIDFKNQCNVGYAFINFRSIQACEIFMLNFNGVEVRKCLPGLNSRKVTEVTPARVQGFEDNVQRLRNSPVMRELAHHPEWMPLIFDAHGVQLPFPSPERPLEPIKPRRRAREEVVAGAGA